MYKLGKFQIPLCLLSFPLKCTLKGRMRDTLFFDMFKKNTTLKTESTLEKSEIELQMLVDKI